MKKPFVYVVSGWNAIEDSPTEMVVFKDLNNARKAAAIIVCSPDGVYDERIDANSLDFSDVTCKGDIKGGEFELYDESTWMRVFVSKMDIL